MILGYPNLLVARKNQDVIKKLARKESKGASPLTIDRLLWGLTTVCQFFGSHWVTRSSPRLGSQKASLNNINLVSGRSYSSRFLSFAFLYALVFQIGVLIAFSKFSKLQQLLGFGNPEILGGWSLEEFCQVVQAVFRLCQFLASMWSGPKLSKFLNNWGDFEMMYKMTFPGASLQKMSKSLIPIRNNIIMFRVMIPSIFTAFLNFCAVGVDQWPNNFVSALAVFLYVGANGPVDDAVYIFSCYVVAGIDRQICQNIKAEKERLGQVDVQVLTRWNQLIKLIRHQVHTLCGYLAVTQLLHTLFQIIILVYQLFTCISKFSARTVDWDNFFSTFIGFIILLLTFYVKCVTAQNIETQEKNLVEELMEVQTVDIEGTVKLQTMVDTLISEPSQINLLNCVVFNKKFILSMLGQCITYTIAITQFSTSNVWQTQAQ